VASSDERTNPDSDAEHIGSLYREIYAVVSKIPRGRVLTYGQLAELAGHPGAARAAGAAMRAITPEMGLPWQRVVGKRSRNLAQLSILDPIGAGIQRALLEDEGVVFTASDGIRLDDHGWLPRD
jgi:methylated-DNA-protein-cysteine methyltransferase-like protein